MKDTVNQRKIEHIQIIENDHGVERGMHYFDDILLRHRALPEIDFKEVNPGTRFLDKELSFPLIISSMTGGDHELVSRINHNLAIAAEKTKVAMGVGSQRVMFTFPEAKESFSIRKYAPTTLLFANLGAVQLNYGFDIKECQQAIECMQADALYLHLNPLQEAIQPEGDTNFKGLAEKIGAIQQALTIPIIIKEVGCGISCDDAERLIAQGINYIDVAGSGGTSWSRIEHHRKGDDQQDMMGILFQDWGLPTPIALDELSPYSHKVSLIASGGIRSGIDMAKALILGASLCGMAAPFLKPAMESPEAVIETIQRIKKEFQTAMFLLGQISVESLIGNDSLLQE